MIVRRTMRMFESERPRSKEYKHTRIEDREREEGWGEKETGREAEREMTD